MSEVVPIVRNSASGKTARIMTALIEQAAPCLLQDLAGTAELSLATTHRLLQELAAEGWISCDRVNRLYAVGPAFLRLAAVAIQGRGFGEMLQPVLREVVAACNESAAFYLYDPGRLMVTPVLAEYGNEPLGYDVDLGQPKYLHAGASGKATMAFLDPAALDAAIERHGLPAMTGATVTDRARLLADLEKIRRAGYAVSQGERVPGAVGIGAPVLKSGGEILGTLLITIPAFRFDPGAEARLAELVKRQALRIAPCLAGAALPQPMLQESAS